MHIFLLKDNSFSLRRMYIIISASNGNEYQEYFWEVKAVGAWD
jgi:hypothetical protein